MKKVKKNSVTMKKYCRKILAKFDKIVDNYWENKKWEFKTFGKFYKNLKKKVEETLGIIIGKYLRKY